MPSVKSKEVSELAPMSQPGYLSRGVRTEKGHTKEKELETWDGFGRIAWSMAFRHRPA